MSVEENKAIVTRFTNEALNGRRFNLFDVLIHPDYNLNEGMIQGREAARQGFTEFMHNPKSHFKIIDLIGEGNQVVSRWEATDGEHSSKGITIFRLVDGMIKDDFFCSEEIKPA